MALSLQQLRRPPNRREITEWLIQSLRDLGFSTTGWQPGRVQHSILSMAATAAEPVVQTASSLVEFAYNSYAKGAALDLYSESRFNNSRGKAVKARGNFTLTNSGSVPHSIVAGRVIAQDQFGNQFVNYVDATVIIDADPVTPGVTLVEFEAALAGTGGQIANNSILTLVTPLAGVTVTNPSPGEDSEGNPLTWANAAVGADPETDGQLAFRNATKWGLISVEKTDTAYLNLALKDEDVNKAHVINDNPRGPGTVDLLVSGNFTLLSDAIKTRVQEDFAEYTFLTDATWPPSGSSTVYVKDPVAQILDLVGNVYYKPSISADEAALAVTGSLEALLTLTPIGGGNYGAGAENLLTVSDITEAINSSRGVDSCTLNDPTDPLSPMANVPIGLTSLLSKPGDGWIKPDGLVMVPGSD